MVGTGRSARLIIARDKLDIDRFGSRAAVAGRRMAQPVYPQLRK
jgi:hypothetical protein